MALESLDHASPEVNADHLIDSLFYTRLTLPYNPPSRWWEDQASDILFRGYNVHDVRRVIRFHLFGREHTPRYALEARDPGTITSFLAQLSPWDERPFLHEFTQPGKVDRFISLCRVSHSGSNQWFFYPSQFNGDSPRRVAQKIDSESARLFRSVPFEEWLRYALGYPSPTVAWLLELHEEFYQMLTMHLDNSPEQIQRFMEIEKHLRTLCPFAYLAVQRSLQDSGAIPRCAEVPEQWHMSHLVNPIRHLFRPEMNDFPQMLKRLSVLTVRYARRYQYAERIEWSRPFNMESYYLNLLSAEESPKSIAVALTLWDDYLYTLLINRDLPLRFLHANWLQLAKYAAECHVGNPDSFSLLQDLVSEMHALKIYQGADAILHGLKWVDQELFNDTDIPSHVKRQTGSPEDDILPLQHLVDDRGLYHTSPDVKVGLGEPFIRAHDGFYFFAISHANGAGNSLDHVDNFTVVVEMCREMPAAAQKKALFTLCP